MCLKQAEKEGARITVAGSMVTHRSSVYSAECTQYEVIQ